MDIANEYKELLTYQINLFSLQEAKCFGLPVNFYSLVMGVCSVCTQCKNIGSMLGELLCFANDFYIYFNIYSRGLNSCEYLQTL